MKDEIILAFIEHAKAMSRGQEWQGHSVEAILEAIAQRISGTPGKYKAFVAVYFEFFKELVGIVPKMTAGGGASLKRIITYLTQISNDHTEDGALDSWRYILGNWKRLSPFLQQQTGLQQIEKNINEIITQLKRGHSDTRGKAANDRRERKELDDALSRYLAEQGGGTG